MEYIPGFVLVNNNGRNVKRIMQWIGDEQQFFEGYELDQGNFPTVLKVSEYVLRFIILLI